MARGYRGARSKIFRRAQEAVLHAGAYAYTGRKDRKGQFRRLWIMKINAALQPFDIKYSQFIKSLKEKDILLDRKILSTLALDHAKIFEEVVRFSRA